MTTQNAIKKMEKAGIKYTVNNNKICGITSKYAISFIDQSGEITCINVARIGDESDIMTDYFAGSYFDNLTRALNFATR